MKRGVDFPLNNAHRTKGFSLRSYIVAELFASPSFRLVVSDLCCCERLWRPHIDDVKDFVAVFSRQAAYVDGDLLTDVVGKIEHIALDGDRVALLYEHVSITLRGDLG